MGTYRVNLGTTAWFSTTVEADGKDGAVELALQLTPGLCHQCAGWGRDWGLELNDQWGYGILDSTGQDVATEVELVSDEAS